MNNNLINCPICGTSNISGSSFCAGCGNQIQNLNSVQAPNVVTQQVVTQPNQNPTVMSSPVNQQPNINEIGYANNSSMNYFKYLLYSMIKPHSEYKKHEKSLENIKNSALLSTIVVVAIVIINLITTMFNAVRQKSYWTDEVEWVWDNLKNIEYFKVIGQSLLLYIGMLVAIAGVYFLASLIIKKDVKFPKLLGITATSLAPIMICTLILSPLISLIYSPLGICASIIGIIYGIMILLELLNDAIVIENRNTRIYFHLICLSILVIGYIIIVYNLILGSLGSILG